jgi:hypothetical protein
MVKRIEIQGALMLCLLLVGASARSEPSRPQSAFGPGEETTYSIKYLGVTAGTVRIMVGAESNQWGRDVLPIVTQARTESVVDLFPVRDKFVTYWDPTKERTIGSDFYADENHSRRRQRIRLDHDNRRATVTEQKEGGAERTITRDIVAGTQDIAAACFALRNKPLTVGSAWELPVFTGGKSFNLRASVTGKETLQTALGAREAFRVQIQTGFDGNFESKREVTAWLLADDTRAPVRIDADFALGTVSAELTSYKTGRSYPLFEETAVSAKENGRGQ